MSDAIISVENLGKKYLLRHQRQERYTALRDIISEKASGLFRRRRGNGKSDSTREEFWALKDVSFEVKQGEVVGIIGRNGAGKSTLLKILSRITDPTEGRIRLCGRVASLLEVGTGFHPELTGRENIFLNGAILGMQRREIKAKFDAIVAFAEVEKFLDTPVKRYSSGMYVRLAFAVAAHLEPEILVVDEVLAVGDAEFQKKCLGKMKEVSRGGRTVLFVSHNMTAVLNLCSKAVLLQAGQLVAEGETREIVSRYLTNAQRDSEFRPNAGLRGGDRQAQITDFEIRPKRPCSGGPVEFVFDVTRETGTNRELPADLAVSLVTEEGTKILQVFSQPMGTNFRLGPGRTKIVAGLDVLPLVPGNYVLHLWVGYGHTAYDWVGECFSLSVDPGQFCEGGHIENRTYPVILPSRWRIEEQPA